MNPNELKIAIVEAMRECIPVSQPPQQPRKKKMEFSKWLMLFAVILCAGTWTIAAISWLLWREFPAELVQYTAWFFGATIAYMLKSGYENKAKIQKGDGEDK